METTEEKLSRAKKLAQKVLGDMEKNEETEKPKRVRKKKEAKKEPDFRNVMARPVYDPHAKPITWRY